MPNPGVGRNSEEVRQEEVRREAAEEEDREADCCQYRVHPSSLGVARPPVVAERHLRAAPVLSAMLASPSVTAAFKSIHRLG